eukprot:jgi/Chrzof1/1041/Cz01g38060.t1
MVLCPSEQQCFVPTRLLGAKYPPQAADMMLCLQQSCQQFILGGLTISFDLLHAFAHVVAVDDMVAGVDQAVLSAVRAKHQAEPQASTFLSPCLCKIQGLQSLAVTTYVQHLILDPAACINLHSLSVSGGGYAWPELDAQLPECIMKLQQLHSLTVSASGIRSIGVDIAHLTSLTYLDLSGNELRGDVSARPPAEYCKGLK